MPALVAQRCVARAVSQGSAGLKLLSKQCVLEGSDYHARSIAGKTLYLLSTRYKHFIITTALWGNLSVGCVGLRLLLGSGLAREVHGTYVIVIIQDILKRLQSTHIPTSSTLL